MSTPLIKLRSPEGSHLFAKLESANPTGSIKDRPALSMMTDALEKGLIKPQSKIIEATSGNTGIALAALSLREEISLTVVVPDNVTHERVDLLRLLGAEIVFSPGEGGSNGAVALADQMAEDDPSFFQLDQYRNPANPLAHEKGTGPEIILGLGGHFPDAFVAGLGTGGTLMGCSRAFAGETEIIAVEPYPGESLGGLRSLEGGFIPPLLDLSLLDGKKLVSNEQAIGGVHWLLSQGIWAGLSSGAIASTAYRRAKEKGGVVVFIVCDDGWRYRESGLYSGDLDPNISYW